MDIVPGVWGHRIWRWVRVGAGLMAAVLLVWMVVLFTSSSTITFRESSEHPGFDQVCAPVAAYLFVSPSAAAAGTDGPVDRIEAYCDRQRTAFAGLIGLLAGPTLALAWVSTRRSRPPSREAVIRAATAANATLEQTGGRVD